MTQPQSATQEVLAGYVERVTYHDAENGFCVPRAKARGHRDVVTVVGHAATISAGEWITASGEWVNDRTHGQQFRAREKRTTVSSSSCAATPSLLMVVALQQTFFSSLVYGSGGTFSRLSPYQFVVVTHQRH